MDDPKRAKIMQGLEEAVRAIIEDEGAKAVTMAWRNGEGDYVVHYIDCNIFDKLTLSGIVQTDATLDAMHAAEMEDDDDTGDD